MRYHNITKDDMLNGDGLRVVLWVSGCEHRCKNCQNPVTWDINCGLIFDDAAKQEIFDELDKPYISGITFSGGDPFHIMNRSTIGDFAKEIKAKYPNKTIWIYTGYDWEEVCNLPYIRFFDVLIDGQYKEVLRDTQLRWRGSSNQEVIDVQKSLKADERVLWCN